MLRAVAFAAAAGYLTVLLPELTSAAVPHGNEVSSLHSLNHPVENEPRKQIPPTPPRTTSPLIRPILAVAILGSLSTALFLLMSCVQRSTFFLKGSDEAGSSDLGDDDEEDDECKKLEKLMSSGDAEGEGGLDTSGDKSEEDLDAEGDPSGDESRVSKTDDGVHRPPTKDPFMEGPCPIPDRGEPLPPADPPVTLGKKEAEKRINEMKGVLSWIAAGKRARSNAGAKGRTLPSLLRQAFYCRQKNKRAKFEPGFPKKRIEKFRKLVLEMEKLLYAHYGVGSPSEAEEEREEEGESSEDKQPGADGGEAEEGVEAEGDLSDDESRVDKIDDGFHRSPTPDPFLQGPDPIPDRGQPLPPADAPVTLGKKEAEDRASEMQEVTELVAAGMAAGSNEGAKGRTLPGLLRQAFHCRQKNKNSDFGEDVPQELVDKFKELVKKMEKLLYDHYGVGSPPGEE